MTSPKVAILISTMDRPDFLIRTLSYYAKMKSPHPVYLSDSSNPENVKKITSFIDKIKDGLEVHYNWYPPGLEVTDKTLSLVKEKYAVINGDDDYEIPSTLTRGAEFLDKNPDYIAAGGYGVSFRLKTSGPYGEIKRLADYPNHSLESETAAQRLFDFMKKCYVITFSVNRIDHLKKIWVVPLPIITTWSELFQVCYCAVSGKVKLMDCLGVIRQIHDRQYHANLMIDWLTEKEFHNNYETFKSHISKKITEMDNINDIQAQDVVKKAFWEYLQLAMADEQKALGTNNKPTTNLAIFKSLRAKTTTAFPVLKTLYRRHLRPFVSNKKQMHYEVTDPNSPYYKDFKNVLDSFTGKDIKNI
ncbi:MAG: hypothetical protein A2816_03115 [Candidatus Yanofskybacteria bacterium RIFCSPHIGHO2_01_FULL_39_44]|nr:MAG: hypothetical protein A2816_03115 [Candidatus Yanofskybacteria bacterium RIFCSPHIGHO2_01_FULL_39_44]